MGRRVSVRRIAEIVDGRPIFADVVGHLTSWNGGELAVTRRGGETVRIPEGSVVAGKVVPPEPVRRAVTRASHRAVSIGELQRLASDGWPAEIIEPLGQWRLRAASGFTRRANSVLPDGDPRLPLDQALARVRSWYARYGLPALVQVTRGADGCDERLVRELAARGWTSEACVAVQTAALAPLVDAARAERVELSREVNDAWLSGYHKAGGHPASARRVLAGGPSVWFAMITSADEGPAAAPAAIGRCVVTGRWAGFAAIEVAPRWRRRGLGTAVLAALAGQAVQEGAVNGYVQVDADNDAALATYGRLGFTPHHHYHYRRAPRSAE